MMNKCNNYIKNILYRNKEGDFYMKAKENNLKLLPPWCNYANSIKALFLSDKEIEIETDDYESDNKEFNITIKSPNKLKLYSISQLLENNVELGNITVIINYEYTGIPVIDNKILEMAFDGNPEVSKVDVIYDQTGTPFTYCVFSKKVVQFYANNLGDINGNFSCLGEDVAKTIFKKQPGIFYCTNNK